MKKLIFAAALAFVSSFASGQCGTLNISRMWSGVKTVTVSPYTVAESDVTQFIVLSSATPGTVTLPSGRNSGFGCGQEVVITNVGTATWTLSCSGCTVNGSSTASIATTQGIDLHSDGLNYAAQSYGIGGGGGSTTPGGSDTQVQYNCNGSFCGSANLTFNATGGSGSTGLLTTTGDIYFAGTLYGSNTGPTLIGLKKRLSTTWACATSPFTEDGCIGLGSDSVFRVFDSAGNLAIQAGSIGGTLRSDQIPDLSASYLTVAQLGGSNGAAQLGANSLLPPATVDGTEGAAPACAAGQDNWAPVSSTHRLQMCNNNGSVDYVLGADSVDALTHKTYDAGGAGLANVFKINGSTGISALTGAGISATTLVGAASPTIVTPTISGKVTHYNSPDASANLQGEGLVGVHCATLQKAETAADTALLTCTPPAAAGMYRLHVSMAVSAQNTATLGWTATWKDSNGSAQAPTNLSLFTSGTAAPALTVTAATNGNYYGFADIDIDNSATNIVIKLTFTGTSFTAKVSASVERLQ